MGSQKPCFAQIHSFCSFTASLFHLFFMNWLPVIWSLHESTGPALCPQKQETLKKDNLSIYKDDSTECEKSTDWAVEITCSVAVGIQGMGIQEWFTGAFGEPGWAWKESLIWTESERKAFQLSPFIEYFFLISCVGNHYISFTYPPAYPLFVNVLLSFVVVIQTSNSSLYCWWYCFLGKLNALFFYPRQVFGKFTCIFPEIH